MKTLLTRPARNDLFRLLDWLDQQSPTAARAAAAQIKQGLRDLADFPNVGRVVGTRHRELPIRFGRDGFVVRYRIASDQIEIVRIFHSRQDRRDA